MGYRVTDGKLNESCLWQRKIGYNNYGEAEHDYGIAVKCRRNESEKLVRGKNNSRIVSSMSYLVNENVRAGDLLDGCTVLAVTAGKNIYGTDSGIEAHT